MRIDIRDGIDEAAENENGIGIEARRDAMPEEMMMIGRREEIGICSMIEEVLEEVDDEVIEAIVMVDLEMGKVGTARRAHLHHQRRRNLHPI